MVKKISGSKPPVTSPKGKIESTQPIQPGTISDVRQVEKTEQQTRAARARRQTRPMTADERQHLFRLIHEEADKMFGANGLPESQRNTVEGAVRKTIDASAVDEDGES